LGVFVLVRTSNPDSDSVQAHTLASGSSVAEMMAAHVRDLATKYEALSHEGIASVGAVVGATKPQDGPRLRAIMPSVPFLVPGYGAQGGTLADIRGMMRPQRTCTSDAGVLVTASRSVIYPKGATSNQSWDAAIEAAAKQLVAELSQA
jgi:orotidine-5'-phosphate decarboxylase